MALLNFPSNPSIGDTWTVGNKTYIWNGNAWIFSSQNFISVATLAVTSSSISTSTTTGALRVTGGTGIGGDLNLGGSATIAGAVTITNMTSATSTITGALVVAGGVGISGDLHLGGQFFVNGQNVLTTASFAYVISAGEDIAINLSNIDGSLIFSNTSTLQTVTSRGSSTNRIVTFLNTTQSTSTTTGAVVINGGLGVAKRVTTESLRITDAIFDSNSVSTNMNSTLEIDSYSLNEYRAAKYLVQIDEGTGISAEYQMNEIMLIANNNGTVALTEYGIVSTNGPMGDFTATVMSNVVYLKFTPTFATQKTISVLRTSIIA